MSSPYHNLSFATKVKPVVINNKKKRTGFWKRLTGGGEGGGVKPVTRSDLNYEKEFYEKYGIIWSGSDESSVINSLF